MRFSVTLELLLVIFCLHKTEVCSLNILGLFPYPGKSHFFVFRPYLEELAKRGHNVTVVSHFPQKVPHQNYHDISLAGKTKILEDVFPLQKSYWTVINILHFILEKGNSDCKTLLNHEDVQKLWKTKQHFDLVVTEQFVSDCSLGLAYKLGAPAIGINSHVIVPWQYERLGIQYHPAYVPFLFLEGGSKPSLYQRFERTILHNYFNYLYKYKYQPIDEETLAEYFDDIPPLDYLAREMKLLLLYHNFVLYGSNLLPSNVIEVGGYHVAKPQELPQDLKRFIEESEHGVIYISFGSMLRASSTPRDKLEAIIGALSELPQRVIWKWDEASLPGNPKNILLSKWLPQNDILAHTKVLAFFSHCGLLGTTEAIYHGVPMIGMPVFGDQPGNAAAIEESGLGLQIQITELSKDVLLEKFRTILNPEFRKKVKFISMAWKDRPISAIDNAVFWTEFAAKYSNITFRSRSADVPLYQYLYLDVFVVFTAIVICIGFLVNYIITLLLRRLAKKFKQN